MKKSLIICLSIVLCMTLLGISGSKLFLDYIKIEIIKLKTSEAEYPWINKKPIDFNSEGLINTVKKLEAPGISLSVPWEDMSLTYAENDHYTFQSENIRLVISKEHFADIEAFIQTSFKPKKASKFYYLLTKNYGTEILNNPYEFDKLMLNTVHSDLSNGFFHNNLNLVYSLLVLKSQLLPKTSNTGIYHIKNDKLLGFQFGTESTIVLWVYNNNGEKYEIHVSRKIPSNTLITKSILDEVNTIVPTIQFSN